MTNSVQYSESCELTPIQFRTILVKSPLFISRPTQFSNVPCELHRFSSAQTWGLAFGQQAVFQDQLSSAANFVNTPAFQFKAISVQQLFLWSHNPSFQYCYSSATALVKSPCLTSRPIHCSSESYEFHHFNSVTQTRGTCGPSPEGQPAFKTNSSSIPLQFSSDSCELAPLSIQDRCSSAASSANCTFLMQLQR